MCPGLFDVCPEVVEVVELCPEVLEVRPEMFELRELCPALELCPEVLTAGSTMVGVHFSGVCTGIGLIGERGPLF